MKKCAPGQIKWSPVGWSQSHACSFSKIFTWQDWIHSKYCVPGSNDDILWATIAHHHTIGWQIIWKRRRQSWQVQRNSSSSSTAKTGTQHPNNQLQSLLQAITKLGGILIEKEATNFLLGKVGEPHIILCVNHMARQNNHNRRAEHTIIPDIHTMNFPAGKYRKMTIVQVGKQKQSLNSRHSQPASPDTRTTISDLWLWTEVADHLAMCWSKPKKRQKRSTLSKINPV